MDGLRNKEGYIDYPAYKAQKAVDGAEAKAFYTFKTMQSVARLAGMELVGTVRVVDRTGRIHDMETVLERREHDRQDV